MVVVVLGHAGVGVNIDVDGAPSRVVLRGSNWNLAGPVAGTPKFAELVF